jgi:hypothetical protein
MKALPTLPSLYQIDAESALYFSGVTYTSLGYGDLMLPKPWRMAASLETLTGILMCGLSTGLFFAIVMRWIGNWMQRKCAFEFDSAAPMNKESVVRKAIRPQALTGRRRQ